MIITNGEYFNKLFQRKTHLISFPFNEAFVIGNVTKFIFSDEFIKERVNCLNTTFDHYHSKIDQVINHDYLNEQIIELYFGEDVFCMINCLVLLAYLDVINYHQYVKLNIIDEYCDDVVVLNHYKINPKGFYRLYLKVFIHKQKASINCYLFNRAIKAYLAYHNGNMVKYLKEHDLDQKILGFTNDMMNDLYERAGKKYENNNDVS